MFKVARGRAPHDVGLKLGSAEALSFEEGSFERAVTRLLVHLVNRPRVFAETSARAHSTRRAAIATFDPTSFTDSWLNPFFPSIAAIDCVRFPTAEALSAELDESGFETKVVRLDQTATFDRAKALEKIRGKHIGTFDLIDEDEYEGPHARRAWASRPGRDDAALGDRSRDVSVAPGRPNADRPTRRGPRQPLWKTRHTLGAVNDAVSSASAKGGV